MLGNSLPTRSKRRSGVFPMRSSKDCPTAGRSAGSSTFADAGSVIAISGRSLRRKSHRNATKILRIGCNSPWFGYGYSLPQFRGFATGVSGLEDPDAHLAARGNGIHDGTGLEP